MTTARKGLWVLAGTLVVGVAGFATTASGSDDTPVTAAAPVTQSISDARLDVERFLPPTTTTTAPPATTVPPTTAAPTTTAPPPTMPPATAPPTTAAPKPPPPPPPPTTAPPPPPPPAGPKHGSRNIACEQYMYNQINAARANVGRGSLGFDSGIQYIAVDWSDHMSGNQVLAHNPDYGDQIVRHRNYRNAGENVGRGYDQAGLFQAFMNSPGHRQNIESGNYSQVTVGCLTDSSGQLWVTQNFWG